MVGVRFAVSGTRSWIGDSVENLMQQDVRPEIPDAVDTCVSPAGQLTGFVDKVTEPVLDVASSRFGSMICAVLKTNFVWFC